MKPPNAFEHDVLDVVLKELRRAVRIRGQLSLTIDPFVRGGGCHVFASPNTAGRSYTIIEAPPRRRRKP